MKNIILLLFVLISITACSQLPQTRTLTNEKTLVIFAGGTKVDSAFIIPHFPDTLTANYGPAPKFYAGNLIRVGDQIFMRNNDATGWILQFGLPENTSAINLSGLGVGVYKTEVGDELQFKRLKNVWGLIISDATDSVLFTIDSSLLDLRYLHNSISCGLTCDQCGVVTWTGTGLNFNVSPADYNLDYVPYHFSGDSVSLDPSDGTFNRFDAIVLTSAGLSKVTGLATADPQLPQTDPCQQIVLTYVFVQANATTPTTISDEVIYDENTETWTHATAGTITTNFAGTAQVFHLTKSITISSWNNGSYIEFTAPSSLVPNNYTTFSFWIRLTAVMVNNQNISVQFFSNTTAVSNNVVGQITKGNISTYQSVGFNMSQFTFTSPTFNIIRLTFHGNNANTTYIDWVRLQAGIAQQQQTGLTNAYSRITDGTNTATATGGDIFKIRTDNTLSAIVTNNDATHGDNVLMKVDTNNVARITSVYRRVDSVFYLKNGTEYFAYKDSSGSGPSRFGVAGEDATAAQNRSFTTNGFNFDIINTNPTTKRIRAEMTSATKDILVQTEDGTHQITASDYPNFNIQGKLQVTQDLAYLQAVNVTPTRLHSVNVKADSIYFTSGPAMGGEGLYVTMKKLPHKSSLASNDSLLVVDGNSRIHKIASSNIGGVNIYNSDGSLTTNRTVTLGNKLLQFGEGANYISIDTASGFQASTLKLGNSLAVSFNPSATNGSNYLWLQSYAPSLSTPNNFKMYGDSTSSSKRLSYETNINGSLTSNSLTSKKYVDSLIGSGPRIVSLVVYPDTSTGSSTNDYYVYYTIPANTFANDGDAVRIEVQYATTGVDTKAVELQIGGIGVSGTASATTAGFYVQRAVFSRHGSGSAVGRGETWRELTFTGVTTSDPAINWTVDNDIRTRINSVTAGSIIIQRVEVTIEKQQ